jgi:hypothetical protein
MSDEDRAGRTGCADDRGLPAISGDTAEQRWAQAEELKKIATEPLITQQDLLIVRGQNGQVVIDTRTGQVQPKGGTWSAADSNTVGAHGLVFKVTPSGDPNRSLLICDSSFGALWSSMLDSLALSPATVAGDKVYVTTTGRDKAKAFVEARKLVDGSLAWRKELDDVPASFVVASADWVAVATGDEKVAVFKAADGKAREPLPVGGKPVAPALCGDILVIAGENRIAAHDLASAEWIWNYKDQDNIGMAIGQPVILGETIWVGTTKRGLVAIGNPTPQAKK